VLILLSYDIPIFLLNLILKCKKILVNQNSIPIATNYTVDVVDRPSIDPNADKIIDYDDNSVVIMQKDKHVINKLNTNLLKMMKK